jgi:hypothetical protein
VKPLSVSTSSPASTLELLSAFSGHGKTVAISRTHGAASCNARHERAGWEWEGEALEQLDVKVLCSSCYLDARKLSLGY